MKDSTQTNDFVNLAWALKSGIPVSRLEVENALDALPLATLTPGQNQRMKRLLSGALGGNPRDFRSFEHEAPGLVEFPPDWVEAELRDSVLDLRGTTWQTPLYLELVAASACAQREEWSLFEQILERAQQKLDREWANYCSLYIHSSEVTQETVLGHRLLEETFELWREAIDRFVDGSESSASWDEALELAEHASRLSTMCHLYSRRVAKAAS